MVVMANAAGGATLLALAAFYILPMVGLTDAEWPVRVAVPSFSGIGAAVGGWVGWRCWGKT
jgi:hypothetical protein